MEVSAQQSAGVKMEEHVVPHQANAIVLQDGQYVSKYFC